MVDVPAQDLATFGSVHGGAYRPSLARSLALRRPSI
jgi:hypothetical protein